MLEVCMRRKAYVCKKEGTRIYVGTDFSHCLNGESMKFCGKLDCTWVKVNPRKFPSVKEYIYIFHGISLHMVQLKFPRVETGKLG